MRAFAEVCKAERRPLHTLSRGVENYIVEVGDEVIRRESSEGTKQTAHIGYAHVEQIWRELAEQGHSSTEGKSRVFALALIQAAMPDCIDALGNRIYLRDVPCLLVESQTDAPADSRTRARLGGGRGGGEGELHRRIRLHVFERPNEALAGLEGGPWTALATERVLETQDRVDVVVQDARGRIVLIEVKPWVCSDELHATLTQPRDLALALAPYAQAAKYRAQWHVLYGTPLPELRCVVAAPAVPTELGARILHEHGVESVAVELP